MASHLGVQTREPCSNLFHITKLSVLRWRFFIHQGESVSSTASAHRPSSRIRNPIARKLLILSPVESILCTTHIDSRGSFFLQRCNRSSEPGILLSLGLETVNVLFDLFDLGPIFHNVQDEHILVVIRAIMVVALLLACITTLFEFSSVIRQWIVALRSSK